jgi:tetratricopeptide (TPR) repeat protein
MNSSRLRRWAAAILGVVALMSLAGPSHASEWGDLFKEFERQRAAGRHREAVSLAKRMVRLAQTSYADKPGILADSLSNLGLIYWEQGRYAEAEPLYQQSLRIYEALGPEHYGVAYVLNNLANLYKDQSKYAEAERLYQRALRIQEKARGPDHPQVAAYLNSLASL